MSERDIVNRTTESLAVLKGMYQLLPAIRECESNPDGFWELNKPEIILGLINTYSQSDNYDTEILIPVHHNKEDLALLFYGLSKQVVSPNRLVGLTVVMHNNIDDPDRFLTDDGSWGMIIEMKNAGAPIRILPFIDPLLNGPYLSWQYLVTNSIGNKIAILDADSIAPENWIERIVKPLEDNPEVKFTGGVRIEPDMSTFYGFSNRVTYLGTMLTNLINPGNPNLPEMNRFLGGQAAYDGDTARNIVRNFIGYPGGDGVFSENMVQKYGSQSFAFADAPVFSRVTNPIEINLAELNHRFQRMLQLYLPNNIGEKLPSSQVDFNDYIYHMNSYSPWFRPILSAYLENEILSGNKIASLLSETASSQGFSDNAYVTQYIEWLNQQENYTVHDEQTLIKLFHHIAENCHRPTFLSHLES